jgi:superfamily II DNA or RNA helicase
VREFLDEVRETASKSVWSRGVELARGEAVRGLREEDDGSVVLQVSERKGMISHTATLHLEDEEWQCSCPGPDDPCLHVAAATIALHQARKQGQSLPAPKRGDGSIHYRLTRARPSLAIERDIVHDGGVFRLESTLAALASGRIKGPPFTATQADLAAERALGTRRRGLLPQGLLEPIFKALADCPDVTLEGEPIQVSTEPVLPYCRVVDAPGGFRLVLDRDPSVDEVLGDGVTRCGSTLRLAGEGRLSGRELQDLVRGRFYSHTEVAELVTDIIPGLRERIQVGIETDKLPETSQAERPWISLRVERRDNALSVLPLLVYGEPGSPPVARVDGGELVHLRGSIPVRDKHAESLRTNHLRETLGLRPGYRVDLWQRQAIEFAARLREWTGPIEGDAHLAFTERGALAPDLEIAGDRIAMTFRTRAEEQAGSGAATASDDGTGTGGPAPRAATAKTNEVLRAWQAGDSLVPLEGGGMATLPADWLDRFGDQVADLLAAQPDSGPLPTSVLPDLARLCGDLDHPPPPALERLRPLIEDFDGIADAPLPADFRGALRRYQKHGVDWLWLLRDLELGALLADDMGLGKTVQALCAVRTPALVVCPTSVLFNWKEELARFRPGLSVHVYHGPGRTFDPDADVTLTSYAILRLDIDELAARRFETVVLDEAQNIKNPESQVAQAAYRLDASFRIALTGTPVENRLEELWSQLHFLNRGLLGGRAQFRERYARPIADGDAHCADRLRERIRPFLLRRRKQDVAPELPPRTEIVLHCELSNAERAVYDAVRAATVEKIVAQLSEGGSVLAALEALLRLRQAACHSALVPGQLADGSTKLELLASRLEEAAADGHKALVFSQWTSLLDLVEPVLEREGLGFTRLDGSTRDREAVVNEFQSDSGPPVMLVSLKAGGTGLNLTAADHVFLLDPWWNPAVEDQATGRAHRIGQTRPVVVHRLVAQNTVEEGILELHARKRALSEVAIEAGGGEAQGLTRDDLLALLS